MAAGFLVTLYEYSPVFYISVVSLCFVVTAAIVLGWFGFDVPVILRTSDETESVLPPPEKQMVQVTNPFGLEIGSGPASVTDGVSLKPLCLKPCVLSCFWGCEVNALQRVLHAHQHGTRLAAPHHFQELLRLSYLHHQSFHIGSEDVKERHTEIPADQGITDFGPLPRERYPLVAVLTLTEPEVGHEHIVASVNVLHVPDSKYSLAARFVFRYLLTSQGNMYELKPLFMSADDGGTFGSPGSEQSPQPNKPSEDTSRAVPEEEESWSEGRSRDCVVCQSAAVNRVLLPCRHACVCDSCVSRFQHCPICRAFILESFPLTRGPAEHH